LKTLSITGFICGICSFVLILYTYTKGGHNWLYRRYCTPFVILSMLHLIALLF